MLKPGCVTGLQLRKCIPWCKGDVTHLEGFGAKLILALAQWPREQRNWDRPEFQRVKSSVQAKKLHSTELCLLWRLTCTFPKAPNMNKVCFYLFLVCRLCDTSSFWPENTRNAARAIIQVSFVTGFTISEAERKRWALALFSYDSKNSKQKLNNKNLKLFSVIMKVKRDWSHAKISKSFLESIVPLRTILKFYQVLSLIKTTQRHWLFVYWESKIQ